MIDKNDLSNFKRILDTHKYYFNNNKLILKTLIRKTKYIESIKPSIYLSDKYLTMDLETRVINEIMEVYCCSIFNGKNHDSFYLTEYKNSSDMLKISLLSIFKRKYNGYKIYFHNFSEFDSVFLLNILVKICNKVEPLIRDGKLIEIKVTFGKYHFIFRDSYLLLLCSLAILAISFNIENKGLYPYLFVNNPNIKLDYIGKIPSFENFVFKSNIKLTEDENNKIALEIYNEYCKEFKNKELNLKDETIKYCNLDTKILYDILNKFSNFIFDEIRLDIFKYPTLSSLSFAIFRCKFLNNHKLPIIKGQMYRDMKKAYI